ncbi:hypothetical protein FZI85_27510 [Mycobacterium sp. CBMA293]|nr:hypothetical protein [Mycolicibacterium sp. CBMA 293]
MVAAAIAVMAASRCLRAWVVCAALVGCRPVCRAAAECPAAECPAAECPAAECPAAECPAAECRDRWLRHRCRLRLRSRRTSRRASARG